MLEYGKWLDGAMPEEICMADLFAEFPNLSNDKIIIKRMEESDVEALAKISRNDNVYRFMPPFLYQKSDAALAGAIRNLGGRDFENRKWVIAGVYPADDPSRLIGLAEMFDYDAAEDRVTLNYMFNEDYWNKGYGTATVALMRDYLTETVRIGKLLAYVVTENVYAAKVLEKNGFEKDEDPRREKNWSGRGILTLNLYTYEKA